MKKLNKDQTRNPHKLGSRYIKQPVSSFILLQPLVVWSWIGIRLYVVQCVLLYSIRRRIPSTVSGSLKKREILINTAGGKGQTSTSPTTLEPLDIGSSIFIHNVVNFPPVALFLWPL